MTKQVYSTTFTVVLVRPAYVFLIGNLVATVPRLDLVASCATCGLLQQSASYLAIIALVNITKGRLRICNATALSRSYLSNVSRITFLLSAGIFSQLLTCMIFLVSDRNGVFQSSMMNNLLGLHNYIRSDIFHGQTDNSTTRQHQTKDQTPKPTNSQAHQISI